MMTSGNRRPTARRAVGAVRISKARSDETSTASQEAAIRSYCQALGIELVEVVSDVGRSAYKENRSSRPGLRRARQLIKSGAANLLVCWKIDRVARNARDLLELIEEVEADGGAFASVTEQFDTSTPFGKAMVTVIGALAELESAQKSDRSLAAHELRRAGGTEGGKAMVPTGPTPFGYRRTRNTLTVHPAEAKLVRWAASEVIAGKGVRSLLATINESPSTQLTQRGLTRVLMSPTTAGLRECDGEYIEGVWEPLLEREVWDEVRAVLKDPARRTNPGGGPRWLLAGLVECGICGLRMRSRSHAKGKRYSCPTDHLSIPVADTDDLIERTILATLDRAKWQEIRSRGTRVDVRAEQAELQRRIVERMMVEGTPSEADWLEMREQMVAIERAAAEPGALSSLPDDPAEAWKAGELSLEARRLLVETVLPRIVIREATLGIKGFDDTRVTFPPA